MLALPPETRASAKRSSAGRIGTQRKAGDQTEKRASSFFGWITCFSFAREMAYSQRSHALIHGKNDCGRK